LLRQDGEWTAGFMSQLKNEADELAA